MAILLVQFTSIFGFYFSYDSLLLITATSINTNVSMKNVYQVKTSQLHTSHQYLPVYLPG